jgi:phosphoenolpyruvate-protein kinase (PTS system EI component)
MQDKFFITMKGSEIQSFIREMTPGLKAEMDDLEKQIVAERVGIDKERLASVAEIRATTLDRLVKNYASFLDAIRKNQILADHIDPTETFQLDRQDIAFLRLGVYERR